MPGRDVLVRQGEALLTEWKLPPDADVEALRAVHGREVAADLAIANRLGGIASPESAAMLLALEAATTDKFVRKEARRSLYRLSQRGIHIPAAAPPMPAPPRAVAAPLEGYLSAVDGRGDQLVWLVKPLPGGVAHLFAVLNDPEGLREVDLGETTRKSLRAVRESLREKHEIRMVDAEWRYCDFIIDRAFHWALERKSTPSGDWPRARSQLIKEPVQAMAPLIRMRLEAEAVRSDANSLADSAALLDEDEFRTWFFGPDDIRTYLDEMAQIRDSPLVLNEVQQQERFRQIVERAVEQLFGGELQASWGRRLEEMAYFLDVTGRPDAARRALAAALALETSTRGGRDIPFCENLARISLAAFWQVEAKREEEQARSSLIVTPQQAAREAERRR
jgi:hypothetical protein